LRLPLPKLCGDDYAFSSGQTVCLQNYRHPEVLQGIERFILASHSLEAGCWDAKLLHEAFRVDLASFELSIGGGGPDDRHFLSPELIDNACHEWRLGPHKR